MPLTDDVLSSRENLVKWGIDIHNIVNASKNKPIMSYSDALKSINTDEKCLVDNRIYYLILIVFSLIIIAVIYKKNNI